MSLLAVVYFTFEISCILTMINKIVCLRSTCCLQAIVKVLLKFIKKYFSLSHTKIQIFPFHTISIQFRYTKRLPDDRKQYGTTAKKINKNEQIPPHIVLCCTLFTFSYYYLSNICNNLYNKNKQYIILHTFIAQFYINSVIYSRTSIYGFFLIIIFSFIKHIVYIRMLTLALQLPLKFYRN